MILSAIKLLRLALSMFGYLIMLLKKTRLKIEFIPIIIFSAISVILCLAGILNILLIVTNILFLSGIALLIYYLFKKELKISYLKEIITPGIIIFILASIYFMFFLRGTKLVHYDNFTHWGLITREMLRFDRLPNFTSEFITFQSYPPGSACFIYYVCRIIGNTEGCMMFAQSLLLLAGITTLFAFCNKKNYIGYVLVLLSGVYFLTSNIPIYDLLVDTLLPVAGLAATAIILFYRDKSVYYALPVLCMTVIIKNSGLFFVVMGIFLILYFAYKANKGFINKPFARTALLVVGSQVVLLYLWKRHVSLVFANGLKAKHTFSFDRFDEIFGLKTKEDIQNICRSFVDYIFNLNNKSSIIIVVCILAILIVYMVSKIMKKEYSKTTGKLLIFYVSAYFVYLAGLLGTYLFSMAYEEATSLASIERYYESITVYLIGITVICFIIAFNNTSIRREAIGKILLPISLSVMIIISWINLENTKTLFISSDNNARNELRKIKDEYEIPIRKKYLIYLGTSNQVTPGYLSIQSRYLFESKYITILTKDGAKKTIHEKADEYDYLIVVNEDENIKKIIEEDTNLDYKRVMAL